MYVHLAKPRDPLHTKISVSLFVSCAVLFPTSMAIFVNMLYLKFSKALLPEQDVYLTDSCFTRQVLWRLKSSQHRVQPVDISMLFPVVDLGKDWLLNMQGSWEKVIPNVSINICRY